MAYDIFHNYFNPENIKVTEDTEIEVTRQGWFDSYLGPNEEFKDDDLTTESESFNPMAYLNNGFDKRYRSKK